MGNRKHCYIRPTSRHELCLTLNRRCTAEEIAPNGRDSEKPTIYSPNTDRTRVVYAYVYIQFYKYKERSKAHAVVYLKRRLSFCIPRHWTSFFPPSQPMPSLCIYVSYRVQIQTHEPIVWADDDRLVRCQCRHLTRRSVPKYSSPCAGAGAEIDHTSGRHPSGLRRFFLFAFSRFRRRRSGAYPDVVF